MKKILGHCFVWALLFFGQSFCSIFLILLFALSNLISCSCFFTRLFLPIFLHFLQSHIPLKQTICDGNIFVCISVAMKNCTTCKIFFSYIFFEMLQVCSFVEISKPLWPYAFWYEIVGHAIFFVDSYEFICERIVYVKNDYFRDNLFRHSYLYLLLSSVVKIYISLFAQFTLSKYFYIKLQSIQSTVSLFFRYSFWKQQLHWNLFRLDMKSHHFSFCLCLLRFAFIYAWNWVLSFLVHFWCHSSNFFWTGNKFAKL